MDLGGVKGPEPGSGGDVGTSCDCDGKGTSVLALVVLSLVVLVVVAALALALVVVLGAAREGKDGGTWVLPPVVLVVVVVVVIVAVVVGAVQCLDGDTSLTEPSVVMIILARMGVQYGTGRVIV